MPSPINKKILKHLAELSRIELTAKEEEKLLKDLLSILTYFTELKDLHVPEASSLERKTHLSHAFRDDEERTNTNRGGGKEDFPEAEGGYLKVPPVFE